MTKTLPAIAALTLISLLAIGCGSDGGNGSSGGYGGGGAAETAGKPPATDPSGGAAAVVSASTAGGVGRIIVDPQGMALYDFDEDEGGKPACYGACARAWPPLLTTGEPQVGEGAMASKLSTVRRDDGTTQVTYAGHPLYTFVEDRKPGEAKGNDVDAFGGEWYALQPSGEEAGD